MVFFNCQNIAEKINNLAKETLRNEYFVLKYAKISFMFICHPWRDKVVIFERLMILIIISQNGLDI